MSRCCMVAQAKKWRSWIFWVLVSTANFSAGLNRRLDFWVPVYLYLIFSFFFFFFPSLLLVPSGRLFQLDYLLKGLKLVFLMALWLGDLIRFFSTIDYLKSPIYSRLSKSFNIHRGELLTYGVQYTGSKVCTYQLYLGQRNCRFFSKPEELCSLIERACTGDSFSTLYTILLIKSRSLDMVAICRIIYCTKFIDSQTLLSM